MDDDLTPEDDGLARDAMNPEPVSAQPPTTGHTDIDRALTGVQLGDDVHEHHDVLLGAVAAVQQALNPAAQAPRPK